MNTETEAILDRLADTEPQAAEALRRQFELLSSRREFGLNFRRHLPERVSLPGRPISAGDKVVFLPERGTTKTESDTTWIVETVTTKQVATIRNTITGETVERDIDDLVFAAEFRDPIHPGLKPLHRIDNGPGDAPVHTVINGENYHALEALRYTHTGKVDLIYIDPPYNTGNQGWIYNDRYVGAEDGDKHSKWLAFMERRLLIARELLKDTGLALISIDDREQGRLRTLLDQVFGTEQFVANFVWRSDGNLDNQATVKTNHEYIIAFAKHAPSLFISPVKDPNTRSDSKMLRNEIRNSVVKNGLKNPVSTITLPAGFPAGFDCGVVQARTDRWPHYESDVVVADSRLIRPVDASSGWANARMLRRFIDGGFQPVLDTRDQETVFELTSTGAIENVKVRRANQHHILTVLTNMGTTETAGNALRSMGVTFPYPKPQPLLQYLTSFAPKDAVILDFFGGSGTTTEAVLRLNAEDGGTRQSILVTNNELSAADSKKLTKAGHRLGDPEWESRGVFEYVTRPRIETVVTGTRPDGSTYSEGLPASVEFFELTYENPEVIEMDMAFARVAPLLWLQAGAVGRRIDTDPGTGFDIADTYAVLFNPDAAHLMLEKLRNTPEGTIGTVFIVTEEETQFRSISQHLPAGMVSSRLYSSYLNTFTINTGLAG